MGTEGAGDKIKNQSIMYYLFILISKFGLIDDN